MDHLERSSYLGVILKSVQRAKGKVVTNNSLFTLNFAVSKDNDDITQRFQMVEGYDRRKSRKSAFAFVAVVTVLFLASFTFLVQPFIAPPSEDLLFTEDEIVGSTSQGEEDMFVDISPENASIIVGSDGTKFLYVDDIFWFELSEEMANNIPFNSLPIYENTE
ncbi:hypothetical protein LJC32_03050 [Oscillospiraceae bacterium OttesenSCG-928-F05]|nr:hypothetical protein [Oscillospiraceae bacterium OttesenSCG-928-F05]